MHRTPLSVPKPTGRFRVRRSFFGKAILQREYCEDNMFMAWDDVDFDKACPALLREIAEGKDKTDEAHNG